MTDTFNIDRARTRRRRGQPEGSIHRATPIQRPQTGELYYDTAAQTAVKAS